MFIPIDDQVLIVGPSTLSNPKFSTLKAGRSILINYNIYNCIAKKTNNFIYNQSSLIVHKSETIHTCTDNNKY